MVDILAHTERELRKRVDLSGARVTRTSKALIILCPGEKGTRRTDRCLTLHRDGTWELTEYPSTTPEVRKLASKTPIRGVGRLPGGVLIRLAAELRPAPISGGCE